MTEFVERHPCTSCAEPIKQGATLCPHCGTRQSGGWTGARALQIAGALVTVLSLLFALQQVHGAWWIYHNTEQAIRDQVASARALLASGSHEKAWEILEETQTLDPRSPSVRSAQIEVAGEWLLAGLRPGRHYGEEGLAPRAERVYPQLVIASVESDGEELANLEALLAWANWARGEARLAPERDFGPDLQAAVDRAPAAFYPNLLLGYWHASKGLDPAAAVEHLERARTAGNDPDMVANVAVRTLTNTMGPQPEDENAKRRALLSVLDGMEGRGETFPEELEFDRFKEVYIARRPSNDSFDAILPTLPIERHIAINRWAQAEAEKRLSQTSIYKLQNVIFIEALLLERAGRNEEAIAAAKRAASDRVTGKLEDRIDSFFARQTGELPPGYLERNPWYGHSRALASAAPGSSEFEAGLEALRKLRSMAGMSYRKDPEERAFILSSFDSAITALEAWRERPGADAAEKAKIRDSIGELMFIRGGFRMGMAKFEAGMRDLEALALWELPGGEREWLLFEIAAAYTNSDRAPLEVWDELDAKLRAAYLYEGLDRLDAALAAGYRDWPKIESELKRLRELPEYASLSLAYGRVPPRDEEE